MAKVLVAMSGGVDSAVAASLLKEQGYDVMGVFMCLGGEGGADSQTSGCCSPQDAADARRVAQQIGIPLYVLNLGDQFRKIIDYFVEEYRNGRTPNPCIQCNRWLKFGKLFQYADSLGIEYVATGHYARILRHGGQASIYRKAAETKKDQSYVLFAISQRYVNRILLPIGEFENKMLVRQYAKAHDFNVHAKPDSQEICFIDDQSLEAFLREKSPQSFAPGKIVTEAGEEIGQHEGFMKYTVGQRKGLGLVRPEPVFVTGLRPAQNEVVVGTRSAAFSASLKASDCNWLCELGTEFDALVQIRSQHSGAMARVKRTSETEMEVLFREPVFAITPGQAAVCYEQTPYGDRLLGGGWIL